MGNCIYIWEIQCIQPIIHFCELDVYAKGLLSFQTNGLNAVNWKHEYEYEFQIRSLNARTKSKRKGKISGLKFNDANFHSTTNKEPQKNDWRKSVQKTNFTKNQKIHTNRSNFLDWNSIVDLTKMLNFSSVNANQKFMVCIFKMLRRLRSLRTQTNWVHCLRKIFQFDFLMCGNSIYRESNVGIAKLWSNGNNTS